jgi:hypothetical protein
MAERKTTFVTINEFGESRRVEIYYYPEMTDISGNVYRTNASPTEGRLFVARLGGGTKLHPTSITLFTIDPLRGVPRGNTKVVAEDGSEWHYHRSVTILNRSNGRIVGWSDVNQPTSKHSGGRY